MPVSSTSISAGLGVQRPHLRRLVRAGQQHLERPRPVGVAAEEALGLQHLELVGDAGRGRQAHGVTHLPDARRIAAALDRLLDHLEDPALTQGQAVDVGRAVGEGRRPGRSRPAGQPPRWPGAARACADGVGSCSSFLSAMQQHSREGSPTNQTSVRACRDEIGLRWQAPTGHGWTDPPSSAPMRVGWTQTGGIRPPSR